MTISAASADSSASPPQPITGRATEIVLIVLVFFIIAGDPPPHVNESHYLSRLKHYWNPSWCAGDLFLESTDTQLVFIWIFGWITRWVSLSATAWIGRLLAWTMLAWSWQRLSWRLVPAPFASVLSAALFVTLNLQAHLAGEWVVGGVEAKCFAYGFVLLALRDLIDRRWNRLSLLLGAATAFHPLVGGWSGAVCGGIWLLDDRRYVSLPSMAPGLVAGSLLALSGVVPALSLTWSVPTDLVAEASRVYVFERLPHHLAPLTLPHGELSRRLVGHAALLVALAALVIPFRRTPVYRAVQFAWGAAIVSIVGLIIELALRNEPMLAARLLRYYWFRLTDFAAPMAVALAATAFIKDGMIQRKSWGAGSLVAALVLCGWQLSTVARQRVANPVPPADARMADFDGWVDVCQWIAENTRRDALFLTPRLNHSFKWRTARPEVVNRKDIPQDTYGIVEWNGRIKDIYYYEGAAGPVGPIDSIGQLGTERVRELAKKYGVGFVLADRSQLLSLPRAYWNEEYVVYQIENPRIDDGR
jgi:hypothetical protein